MYYYTLHRGGTRFCHYCLQAIKTVLLLKLMVRKGEYVGFKKLLKKIKVTIHDFENILVFEDNWKQKFNEPYTNEYQKLAACSYD